MPSSAPLPLPPLLRLSEHGCILQRRSCSAISPSVCTAWRLPESRPFPRRPYGEFHVVDRCRHEASSFARRFSMHGRVFPMRMRLYQTAIMALMAFERRSVAIVGEHQQAFRCASVFVGEAWRSARWRSMFRFTHDASGLVADRSGERESRSDQRDQRDHIAEAIAFLVGTNGLLVLRFPA